MSTIADKLQDLIDAKADMKAALEEKGVEVTGGLVTYADAISNIIQEENEPNTIKFGFNIDKVSLPEWDTSGYTDLSFMYENCMSLKRAPAIDTSNAVDVSYMFDDCQQLEYIPLYDFGNVKNINGLLNGAALHTELNVDGFVNLGMQPDLTGADSLSPWSSNALSNLTHQARVNIINNLFDRASAGYSILGITLWDSTLSDEEIAIATNKGWKLTWWYD